MFNRKQRIRNIVIAVAFVAVSVVASITNGFGVLAASCSTKADCQAQIDSESSTISNSQQQLGALAGQAKTYQDTISQLDSQISTIQSQISDNEAKQVSLQQQIDSAQQQITQQKSNLANDLKAMYIGGQMTPEEMLATSGNISDYIDKQEAYSAVQDKIQSTMNKIASLQKQLQSQKAEIDTLVANLQTQNTQLSSAQAQQASLLSYNESQQSAYNAQITSASSDITALKARLAALNNPPGSSSIVVSGTCGGGYPAKATSKWGNWGCNYAQDNTFDNWAMYNRECVSYTAYMAYSQYGVSAYGWGNAYQWIQSAINAGYTVNQTPAAGTIAIRNVDWNEPGDVGHAMWVKSVNGNGTINVQEYNENYDGTYDERDNLNPSVYDSRGGLYFIHLN